MIIDLQHFHLANLLRVSKSFLMLLLLSLDIERLYITIATARSLA